jgi:hypothetical protein
MNEYIYIKEKEIPLYRGKLVIVLTNSVSEVKKINPTYSHDFVYASTFFGNWKGMQGFFVIFNFDHKNYAVYNGTITHEALHCANFIGEARGIVNDGVNDEPFAYLAEWITDEIYKFINKYNVKVMLKK